MPHPTSRHKATTGELVQAGDPANNAVRVNIVAGAGSGGTAATDDAAYTVGGSSYTPAGGTYRSALDPVDDGDGGAFAMTQTRAIFANIRDDAGDSAMDGANNALRVNIVAGAGSGGTAMTDDTAFTPAGTSFTPAGGTYRSVRDPVDDNDGGAFAMTQNRALLVSIEDSVGDSAMDDANNAVRVNVVAGGAGGVQYTEGDVDATITGTAAMMEVAANTLQPVQGTVADGLLVNLGTNNDVTVTGTVSISGSVDTELPAAVALADNMSNPTPPAVGAFLMGWDAGGGNWDRVAVRTGTGGQLKVDASDVTVPISFNGGTGAVNITQYGSVSITAAAALADNMSNPTAPSLGAFNMGFDGTNWDRIRGDGGSMWVQGPAANAAAAAGNPVWVGGRASTALPTDVGADGDVAALWTNRNGAQVVAVSPHIGLNSDPYNLLHEAAQYTTTQTSTVLVAGGASEKLVVTRVQIQAGGTTAGTLQLYFGTAAFSRGTSRAIFDGEFAPSATLKPGVILEGPFISGTNGDDLLVTDSAAINPLTINVWYYVVV